MLSIFKLKKKYEKSKLITTSYRKVINIIVGRLVKRYNCKYLVVKLKNYMQIEYANLHHDIHVKNSNLKMHSNWLVTMEGKSSQIENSDYITI